MKGKTIREASESWVKEFDAVPISVIEKLLQLNPDELYEITPPAIGDYVTVFFEGYDGEQGEIVSMEDEKSDDQWIFTVSLFSCDVRLSLHEDEFERSEIRDLLPMWGWMWAMTDMCDKAWIEDHLYEIANCGFRIYEQEDYGYLIGIDGAGYDFYESHWIPLYRERGLMWHDVEIGGNSHDR